MDLTNRELASIIWLAIFALAICSYRNVRIALLQVLKAFLARSIVLAFAALLVWITLTVELLTLIGVWHSDDMKITLQWVITFALALFFKANQAGEEAGFYKAAIKEAAGFTVLVLFVIDFHNFNIWLELLLVPTVTVMALMQVFSTTKQEFASARWLLTWVMAIVGIVYLIYGVREVFESPSAFFTFAMFREFLDPLLLSLLLLPFIYLLSTYLQYESAMALLQWNVKDRYLRRFAKLDFFLSIGPRVKLLRDWLRFAPEMTNTDDVHRSIQDFSAMQMREDFPPMVPLNLGWSLTGPQ